MKSNIFRSIFAASFALLTSNIFTQNIVQKLEAQGFTLVRAEKERIEGDQYLYYVEFRNSKGQVRTFDCDLIHSKKSAVRCETNMPGNFNAQDWLDIIDAANKFPKLKDMTGK